METSKYFPNPVDTAGVELPSELDSLIEQMARNVHDVWAMSRMNDCHDIKAHYEVRIPDRKESEGLKVFYNRCINIKRNYYVTQK